MLGGHIHFHNAFLPPILSLGDVETLKNIFKIFEIYENGKNKLSKNVKMYQNLHCNGFFYLWYCITGVQTIKSNRFYSENKFVKQDANNWNDLATCLYRLP